MHGIGNDFVTLKRNDLPNPDPSLVRRICSRHDGIGSDGLLQVHPNHDGSLILRMWNPDGSESGMCGNGLRCAALWADRHLNSAQSRLIHLSGQPYSVVREQGDQYRVQMGRPDFDPKRLGLKAKSPWIAKLVKVGDEDLQATAVSFGNPHLVCFVNSDPYAYLPHGRELEVHPAFKHRTNVHFARIVSPTEIEVATWERGAGPTLACGSGACAVAASAWEQNLASGPQVLKLPGGQLIIRENSGAIEMSGPAAFTFSGEYLYC